MSYAGPDRDYATELEHMRCRAEAAEKALAEYVEKMGYQFQETINRVMAERDDWCRTNEANLAKLAAAEVSGQELRVTQLALAKASEQRDAALARELLAQQRDLDMQETIEGLEAKLEECGDWFAMKQDQDRRITNLEAELAAAKSRLMEVCATLDCTESECGELLAKLAAMSELVDKRETLLSATQAKLAAAEAARDFAYDSRVQSDAGHSLRKGLLEHTMKQLATAVEQRDAALARVRAAEEFIVDLRAQHQARVAALEAELEREEEVSRQNIIESVQKERWKNEARVAALEEALRGLLGDYHRHIGITNAAAVAHARRCLEPDDTVP